MTSFNLLVVSYNQNGCSLKILLQKRQWVSVSVTKQLGDYSGDIKISNVSTSLIRVVY